jgi:hypothetical protein
MAVSQLIVNSTFGLFIWIGNPLFASDDRLDMYDPLTGAESLEGLLKIR